MTPISATAAVMKLGGPGHSPVDARQIADRMCSTPRHLISNALANAQRAKLVDRWKDSYTTTAKGRQAVKDAMNSLENRAKARAMLDASKTVEAAVLPSQVIDALSLSNDTGPKAAFRAAALLALDARGSGTTSEIGRDLDGAHPDPSKVVANVLKYLQRANLCTSELLEVPNKSGHLATQRVFSITDSGADMAEEIRTGAK
jgi:DNA-binding PadR family transcriptional regulator